eukprot:357005-Chlamydomonas_euryale.AAC.4
MLQTQKTRCSMPSAVLFRGAHAGTAAEGNLIGLDFLQGLWYGERVPFERTSPLPNRRASLTVLPHALAPPHAAGPQLPAGRFTLHCFAWRAS